MKEVYLVKWSTGTYDDYREHNKETVFISLLSAEKIKKAVEEYYAKEEPFPFSHCTEEEFIDNYDGVKYTEGDYSTFDRWTSEKWQKAEFNRAWIETLTLEQE